jgi:replication factor C subunit 1
MDENNSKDNLNWVEKYRPQGFDDLYFNSNELQTIKKWIKEFKDKKPKSKNCLFLQGSPGLGKTTIAQIILKEFGYDILEFNASELRNQKLIKDKISKVNSNVNVIECMCMRKKRIGIIFDEIDGLSGGEKSGISEISNIIFDKEIQTKNTPFICITNTSNKKIDTLKKKCIFVKISKPNKITLKKILSKILKKENVDVSSEIQDLLVNKCNFDIRRLINLSEFLFGKTQGMSFKKETLEKMIDKFQAKNVHLTSYEATDKILNNYNSINDTLLYYEYDKSSIGMFIFENFINYLTKNRKANNLQKLKNLAQIYESFSHSDIYDYNIFIKQRYELTDYNCIDKCSLPSLVINQMKRYSFNKFNKLNYSTLINKSSQEYLNSKYISNIKQCFTDYCFTDNHIMICDILLKYIENDYDSIRSIISEYNVDKDLLEKIIKFSSFCNENTLTNLKPTIKKLCS